MRIPVIKEVVDEDDTVLFANEMSPNIIKRKHKEEEVTKTQVR